MMTNLSATHFDTRVCLNRGLASNNDALGGLGIRGKNNNGLLESFDYNTIVKNLCASQSYHFMDMFLTFTYNQKNILESSASNSGAIHFNGMNTIILDFDCYLNFNNRK